MTRQGNANKTGQGIGFDSLGEERERRREEDRLSS